jgi:hypothetical protein
VAALVARLSAVCRDNTDEAMAQIDVILRQESSQGGSCGGSRSGGGSRGKAPPQLSALVSPPQPPHHLPSTKSDEEGDDIDSGDDSDSETNVSSITNPSYQALALSDKKVVMSSATNRRPRPLSSQASTVPTLRGMATSPEGEEGVAAASPVLSGTTLETNVRKFRKGVVTPPTRIQISSSSGSATTKEENLILGYLEKVQRQQRPTSPFDPLSEALGGFFQGGDACDIQPSSSDDIAENLRRGNVVRP